MSAENFAMSNYEENKILSELANRPVLDVCCGSRMFWFDRSDTFVSTKIANGERAEVCSDFLNDYGATKIAKDNKCHALHNYPDGKYEFRKEPFAEVKNDDPNYKILV